MIESLFRDTIDCYPYQLRQGAFACEAILSTPGVMYLYEEWARRNQTWYADVLSDDGQVTIIDFPHREGWSLFNPSIAINEDGDMCATVRSSNYQINEAGHYVIPPEDGNRVRTENYLVPIFESPGNRFEPKGNLSWRPLLLDDSQVVTEESPFPVLGLEDLRLFFHRDWRALATVRDRSSAGICTQLMVDIKDNVITHPTQISQGYTHDKNWVPMLYNEGVRLIERYYPLTVRRAWYPSSGEIDDSPFIARSFRGGSQAIEMAGGDLLAVVHESVTMEPYQKIYLHRFVEIDGDSGGIARVSDPFVFEDRQIEFCAGLIERGEDLILSYGVRDAEAHLLRLRTSTVMDLLREPLSEVRS